LHGPSFIRWAGSKRKSLRQLSALLETFQGRYIEPFAGSAALFFAQSPQSAILGDLNGHLINALRAVRDDPTAIHERLEVLPRNSETYYRIRTEFNRNTRHYGPSPAVQFLYLNRNCFNGLWRTNSSGDFNVPYGGMEMGNNPPLSLLLACSKSLRTAKLRHQDFRKTIAEARGGDFVYADPPYFTSAERTFIEYGKRSFGQRDLTDLIESLRVAELRGAIIALTYSDSMKLDGLPESWNAIRFDVTRNIGGFKGARKRQTEILYTNYGVVSE